MFLPVKIQDSKIYNDAGIAKLLDCCVHNIYSTTQRILILTHAERKLAGKFEIDAFFCEIESIANTDNENTL